MKFFNHPATGYGNCTYTHRRLGELSADYNVDYQWDSVQNVLAFSAKRFLFCFVPMAWYFSVSIPPMRKLAEWFERTCGIGSSRVGKLESLKD